ncbi:hypothetical protein MMC10_004662 [Thelotrema lepadinum]|nr:hypothetical protein [Thelotrema lepadinum]
MSGSKESSQGALLSPQGKSEGSATTTNQQSRNGEPTGLNVPKTSAKIFEPAKDEQRSSSDEWTVVNSEISEDDFAGKEAEEPNSPLGSSIVDLTQQESSVLSDQTNQKSTVAEDADLERENTKDSNRTTEARSRAVSDLSFTTGVHPPPGTPGNWQHGEGEYEDTADFTLEGAHAPTAGNENSGSPRSSVRKTALLRAASSAEHDGKQPASPNVEVDKDQQPIAEDTLPRVLSRIFTSEEWQKLHAKFENPPQESNEVGQTSQGSDKVDESVGEPGKEQYGDEASADYFAEKMAKSRVTNKNSQIPTPATDYDPSFGAELTRERRASSMSEHHGWADSSISSLHSTESGHVPRSMRLGTVLPPKELAVTAQSLVEHPRPLSIKDKPKDSVSAESDESGGVSLNSEAPLLTCGEFVTGCSNAHSQPPPTGSTRSSSPITTIAATAKSSPSKASEDGGVPIKAAGSPKTKLTPSNLELLPPLEPPKRGITHSTVSVLSGNPGKADSSRNCFDNDGNSKTAPALAAAIGMYYEQADSEEEENGKAKGAPSSWIFPCLPKLYPDQSGSAGSDKNAPTTQSSSGKGNKDTPDAEDDKTEYVTYVNLGRYID